jgi:hypothetical protein
VEAGELVSRQKRVSWKRRQSRRARLFERSFHSEERVLFIKSLPCEVTGRLSDTVVNAHTRSRGAGGTYKDIVPLLSEVHQHFDEMPEAKWQTIYRRSKQSVRDRAYVYQQLWEGHRGSLE